ncbi:MAG: RluA family pseudouridine synthase [Lentisphaeria bacterium]|nr:RluA family pseudouridine synthase [Lentisphaeria bacterium]
MYQSKHLNIQILFQDQDIVVISKDSGLLSVPGRGEEHYDSVSSRVKDTNSGCIEQPSVHRLDMDTSGIMVLALKKEAHRNLSIQFQDRKTYKEYEAILEGIPKEQNGHVELPFRLDIDNRPHQIYDEAHGKIGITDWEIIGVEGTQARVLFKPLTGRTHQLRVHAAHEKGIGIPIVGDPLYGNGTGPGQLKLHARLLTFQHPRSNESMTFTYQPPW